MEAKPRKVVALKIKPQRNGIADYGSDEIESSNGMRLSPGRKRVCPCKRLQARWLT